MERESRGEVIRGETLKPANKVEHGEKNDKKIPQDIDKTSHTQKNEKVVKQERPTCQKPSGNDINIHISPAASHLEESQVVHLSLDDSKIDTTPVVITPPATHYTDKPSVSPVVQSEPIKTVDEKQETPTEPVAVPTEYLVADYERLRVVAKEMGRAINDPRVVAALNTPQPPQTIQGTAGQFIQRVLGADAAGDFITNFITALTTFRSNSTANTQGVFNFANYGYAPLDQDYLNAFYQSTQANKTWSITQGKTVVSPAPITRRADNDPRGQHPDFISQDTTSPTSKPEQALDNQTNDTHEELLTPSEDTLVNAEDAPKMNVQDQAVLEVEDTPALSQNTESEKVAEPNLVEETVNVVEKALHSTESAIESLVHTLEEIIKPNLDNHSSESKKSSTKKEKSASYKDMIESVSGQLLQPTGILSLVAPKKPRATKPKTPKTPAKRTSKAAQKAEVIKRKTDTESSQSPEINNPQD